MVQAVQTPGLPPLAGSVLGTLHMFELRESIAVPHDVLEQEWTRLGLPPDLLPKPRSGRDAFRKATPRRQLRDGLMLNEYKGKALPPNTVMACVLVRAIPTKTKTKFSHSNRAAVYLKDDNTLEFENYMTLDPREQIYLSNIVDAYKRAQMSVDGSQLREKISQILRRNQALPFREGAYMLPATKSALSAALEALIPWLNTYTAGSERNRMTSIAYLDTPQQQIQLGEVIQEFITKEILNKQVEARAYVERRRQAKKTVGDGKKTTALGELLSLQTLIASYEDLMKANLKELSRQAKYAEQTITDILDG